MNIEFPSLDSEFHKVKMHFPQMKIDFLIGKIQFHHTETASRLPSEESVLCHVLLFPLYESHSPNLSLRRKKMKKNRHNGSFCVKFAYKPRILTSQSPKIGEKWLPLQPKGCDAPTALSESSNLVMLFYESQTCADLHDRSTGLYLYGDLYVADEYMREIGK